MNFWASIVCAALIAELVAAVVMAFRLGWQLQEIAAAETPDGHGTGAGAPVGGTPSRRDGETFPPQLAARWQRRAALLPRVATGGHERARS